MTVLQDDRFWVNNVKDDHSVVIFHPWAIFLQILLSRPIGSLDMR